MGHSITAVVLRGAADPERADAFGLTPVPLAEGLTMCFVSMHYAECWGYLLGDRGQLPGPEPTGGIHNAARMLPRDRALATIIRLVADVPEPTFALLVTNYFGGIGGQAAAAYQGDRWLTEGEDSINAALRALGVRPEDGKDEFDTVGLGRFRVPPDDPGMERFETLLEILEDEAGR
ncbi:MAG: hypothetical protein AAGK21_01630 [Bacteroidota bacterium]